VVVYNPSLDLSTLVAAAETFNTYSNAWEEGGAYPESIVRKPLMFSGRTQIFKDRFEATGTAMSNINSFPVSDGSLYYYNEGILDSINNLKRSIGYGILLNPEITTLETSSGSGTDVAVTQGLLSTIRNGGIQYGKPSVWSINDFDNLVISWDAEKVPSELHMKAGNQIFSEIQNSIINSTDKGGIVYASLSKAAKTLGKTESDTAVDFGISAFKKNGYSILMSRCWDFNNPTVTSMTGQAFPSTAIFFPMDEMVEGVTGERMKSIALKYKVQGDGLDRRYWANKRGPEITGEDKTYFEYGAEVGLQVNARNRFTIVEP
jgi:hypothetical protein